MSFDMEMDEYHDEIRIKNLPKKCLITGGCGFIGSNFIKYMIMLLCCS